MCGIAGILSPKDKNAVRLMTAAMKYRGPDEEGYYFDDFIALGQRRLSIIDLTTGKQPISNESDNLYLICNGEIYNSPELRERLTRSGHQFKTTTDVEVILHLYEDYGKDCVKHLRGMFALAIWDKVTQTLFLARDHIGQKPLFFYKSEHAFIFASEVKAILSSGLVEPELDLNGLWHYVSLRFIPDRYSLFKGIQKLPAATSLLLKDSKITFEKYWDLDFTNKLLIDEDQIVDGLDELLSETVKMHMISDVQVGAFLSGGIDSSTVAAMMAKTSSKTIPAFSIGVKEQSFNELPYARMVVDRYALEPHERIVEPDIINLIPSMIYHMDEPSDPYGIGVYQVAQVASEVVKVVLGGDGGDENFAGYDRFAGNRLIDYYCLMPRWFREFVIKNIVKRIPESFGYKSFAQKALWVNEMSLFKGGERYAQSLSFLRFTKQAKEQLFTSSVKAQIDDYDSFSKILSHYNSENVNDFVDRMLYTDLMTRMPDHLLVIADRMSMAHSLESRSPLIDYKIVEYAASIPAGLKLKGMNLKYILKKVAARYLPKELIYRRKQGFTFPLGIWMRTELRVFLDNFFAQSRFVELGIIDRSYLQNIWQEHLTGKVDHNYRLWILINLEIWYRLFFENETIDSMRALISRLRVAS